MAREKSQARKLPAFYEHYYDYPKTDLVGQVISEERTPSFILHRVEFSLSLPTEIALKDPEAFKARVEQLAKTDRKTADDLKLRYVNRVDYYIPSGVKPGSKRPAILISPILGGNMVVDHFARYYAGRGYAAVIVHRKRILWDPEDGGMEQMENYMRVSAIRLGQALDWLEAQPEVDSARIGAFGVSYGAILHTVLSAVEPRIRYHVLSMPAGDLADVIADCPDKAITKVLRDVRERYGWSDQKIREDLKAVLRTDPLLLAPYVPRRQVEVYIAAFDRVVGAGRSWKLWKALGRPKLRILPFGHYGGILVFPHLQTQSYLAFKRHLRRA